MYFLSSHVFLCIHADHVVFLDLRADRYFAMEVREADEILRHVPGWKADPPAQTVKAPDIAGDAGAIIRTLLQRGILTSDPSSGKSVLPVDAMTPEVELNREDGSRPAALTPRDLLRFARAVALARYLLHSRPLEHVVLRVQRRRVRKGCVPGHTDLSELHRYAMRYDRMRPFVFAARGACLLESLGLIEFLACYGMYPKWVFGVRTIPFAAHCWVQQDGVVLNDSVGHTRGFTPIMAA